MNESFVKLSNELNRARAAMPPNTLRCTPAPPPKPVAPRPPIPAAAAPAMPYVDHGLSEEDMLAFLFETGETVVTELSSQE